MIGRPPSDSANLKGVFEDVTLNLKPQKREGTTDERDSGRKNEEALGLGLGLGWGRARC